LSPAFFSGGLRRHCPDSDEQASEVKLQVVLGDAAIHEPIEFDACRIDFCGPWQERR
jgi:hypothetical protein